MKKNDATVTPPANPETVSLGTRLAEKNRAVANQLTDEERERLLRRGMQLIYAEGREKKPAHRR